MARKARRRMGKKGSFRGFARKARSSGSAENMIVVGVAAAAYGAFRSKIEALIQPVTSKLPIGGQYVDELALGTLGYFAAKGKLGNNKYIKSLGKAMFIVEATRIGSGIGQGMINKNASNEDAYNY